MFKTADMHNIYYSTPFLAFADCIQTGGLDSDIQTEYNGVGYDDVNTWLEDELKCWNVKGVKNKFKELTCEDDENSFIGCYDQLPSKDIFLRNICILKNDITETKKSLWLYPVKWFDIGPYLFIVPEIKITDEYNLSRTFGTSHFSGVDKNILFRS